MANDHLAPIEVERLLSLRHALEEAVRRVASTGPLDAVTTTVLLDAVCERATRLVLVAENVQIAQRDAFDTLVNKLMHHLIAWRPAVHHEVLELHRARNAAQHDGLSPDRGQLPRWAAAAQTYVIGLVRAEYNVNLRDLSASQVIRDSECRTLVHDAETALAADDYAASLAASSAAWGRGVRRWIRLHAGRGADLPTSVLMFDSIVPDPKAAAINSLREQMAGQAFGDSAEHRWFQSIRGVRPDLLIAEDASRALGFTYGWLVAFETVEGSWLTDREHAAAVARRRVRTHSAASPQIAEIHVDPEWEDGRVLVRYELADVPGEADWEEWTETLRALLRGEDRTIVEIDDDGTIRWHNVSEEDIETVTLRVRDVLNKVGAAVDQARAQRDAEEREEEEAAAAYAAEVMSQTLPWWVRGVARRAPVSRRVGDGPVVLVQMSEGTLGPLTRGRRHQVVDIAGLVREHAMVEQSWTAGGGELVVEPALPADELAEVLHSVTHAIDEAVREANLAAAQKEQRLAELRRRAKATLTGPPRL